jgi:hypothetical protein
MTLTDEDIRTIADIVESRHSCRYSIEPERMEKLMGFVEAFYSGAIETRAVFRTMVIRMIVWGSIAGFIALLEVKFRWVRPLLRFITGSPG